MLADQFGVSDMARSDSDMAHSKGNVMIDPYEAWCEKSEELWKERAEMKGLIIPHIICNWTADCSYWTTDCGEAIAFFKGGPMDNKFKYCPYCGKELKEIGTPGSRDQED